jgi:hypothetical protein
MGISHRPATKVINSFFFFLTKFHENSLTFCFVIPKTASAIFLNVVLTAIYIFLTSLENRRIFSKKHRLKICIVRARL